MSSPANPDLRQYNPIWKRLKADGSASVEAHPSRHKRIIKAVKKEKWLDLEYKLELEPRTATLEHAVKGTMIVFRLVYNLIPDDF
jgi:hypothetical protein